VIETKQVPFGKGGGSVTTLEHEGGEMVTIREGRTTTEIPRKVVKTFWSICVSKKEKSRRSAADPTVLHTFVRGWTFGKGGDATTNSSGRGGEKKKKQIRPDNSGKKKRKNESELLRIRGKIVSAALQLGEQRGRKGKGFGSSAGPNKVRVGKVSRDQTVKGLAWN